MHIDGSGTDKAQRMLSRCYDRYSRLINPGAQRNRILIVKIQLHVVFRAFDFRDAAIAVPGDLDARALRPIKFEVQSAERIQLLSVRIVQIELVPKPFASLRHNAQFKRLNRIVYNYR